MSLKKLLLLMVFGCSTIVGHAMDIKVIGNTIILSGSVKGDELAKIKDAFFLNPAIELAILRNSHGGDAWTGYRVGEFFRTKGITTAVSGYCISSCSRMFLGGKRRVFTDDYPARRTFIGFHGHYNNGVLNKRSVNELGLYSWILKYSDGKADAALVEKWINIELANGMVTFMHPDAALELGASVHICTGKESSRPLACEKMTTNALDRGVMTDAIWMSSPDQFELLERGRAKIFTSSGYAQLFEIDKLPLDPLAGVENYKRYLLANAPKAFAVSVTKQHWAWNAEVDGVNEMALQRCAERAKQPCILYAVDDNVVFKP